MPDHQNNLLALENITADDVASTFTNWGISKGLFDTPPPIPKADQKNINEIFSGYSAEEIERLTSRLQQARIIGVCKNESGNKITILTRKKLGARTRNPLPAAAGNIAIEYIEGAAPEEVPETVPHAGTIPTPTYMYNGKIACGSSLHVANIFGAGTLGCLVKDKDENIFGLSNNHVCGNCNHIEQGMFIMSPAPMDAQVAGPPPSAIGTHHKLLPLQSGNPGTISLQRHDASIFKLTAPDYVTSMQGDGAYDTPNNVASPRDGTKVKKVGRTTGLTTGIDVGSMFTPLAVPYKSPQFQAIVYFESVRVIVGDNNSLFSTSGDSGSLVVTEDESNALGLIFAGSTGSTGVSYYLPLAPTLEALDVTLVSGHNL